MATTEVIEDTLRPFDKAQGGEPVEPQAQGRLRKANPKQEEKEPVIARLKIGPKQSRFM